jgi:hypothetical protein
MNVPRVFRRCSWVTLAMVLMPPALAQEGYALESPLDDHDETKSIRYFGSAKDNRGALLAEVTVLLDTANVSRIFVTDTNGRFRAHLPLDTPMSAVTPNCAKEGYVVERVTKRPGPKLGRASVQVDCVLRRAS